MKIKDNDHIGIMDIGSNAVRAVVYKDASIGAMEIYNNKIQIELPKLLDLDAIDISHEIYNILGYFVNIFKLMEVNKIICVGTAALRKHKKAAEFQDIIYNKFNLKIDIITGDNEAQLSAMGLIYGISNAKGIVVDLGGGSLEISQVNEGKVLKVASLSLGLKAGDFYNTPCTEIEAIDLITQANFPQEDNIYLLGGAFRILARQYMYDIHYPLKNLHNFTINPASFLNYLQSLNVDFEKRNYYHEKINHHAIVIITSLLKYFKPNSIIVSNYGLKEGIFFNSLPINEQKKDVVYHQIKSLTNFDEDSSDLKAYHALFKSIMVEYEEFEFIIDISIMLIQCYRYIDNTMQDIYLINLILTTSVPLHQKDRLMLLNIISGIFNTQINRNILALSCTTIPKKEYYNLCIITALLKIMLLIDGPKMPEPNFTFEIAPDDYVKYTSKEILPRSIAFKVMKLVQEIGKLRKKIKYFKSI